MQRRSTGGAAVVALTLVLLSGCGGSSSNSSSSASSTSTSTTQSASSAASFKSTIGPVLNQFKAVSQSTGRELENASTQTDAQIGAKFQQFAARWQAAVTKLATLTPPAAFSAAYNRLKLQVAAVEADLAAVVAAAQNHNAAAAKSATTKLVNDIVHAKATATTITNRLGTQ